MFRAECVQRLPEWLTDATQASHEKKMSCRKRKDHCETSGRSKNKLEWGARKERPCRKLQTFRMSHCRNRGLSAFAWRTASISSCFSLVFLTSSQTRRAFSSHRACSLYFVKNRPNYFVNSERIRFPSPPLWRKNAILLFTCHSHVLLFLSPEQNAVRQATHKRRPAHQQPEYAAWQEFRSRTKPMSLRIRCSRTLFQAAFNIWSAYLEPTVNPHDKNAFAARAISFRLLLLLIFLFFFFFRALS